MSGNSKLDVVITVVTIFSVAVGAIVVLLSSDGLLGASRRLRSSPSPAAPPLHVQQQQPEGLSSVNGSSSSATSTTSPSIHQDAGNPSQPMPPATTGALVIDNITVTAAEFPRALDLAAFQRRTTECLDDHVERLPLLPTRFLSSKRITKRYGLSNVLMFLASLFAYGGIDNRAIYFPLDAPIDVEKDLLDIARTTQCLAMVNVRLVNRTVALTGRKQVSAWRFGVDLGSRWKAGSTDQSAFSLLSQLKGNMGRTAHVPAIAFGDFFMRFPFYTIRPADLCFYIKRMVFSEWIRYKAEQVLTRMHTKGVRRYLAVHVRLESDAVELNKGVFTKVSPASLQRFWRGAIRPLIAATGVDSVYICAGVLDYEYLDVLHAETPVPLYFKNNPRVDRPDEQRTTSHQGAAVDLLVAEGAAAVVSMDRSTFVLSLLSRRCPSPKRDASFEAYRNTTTLYQWDHGARSVMPADSDSDGKGVFIYSFQVTAKNVTTIAPTLSFASCNEPWSGSCFYPV